MAPMTSQFLDLLSARPFLVGAVGLGVAPLLFLLGLYLYYVPNSFKVRSHSQHRKIDLWN